MGAFEHSWRLLKMPQEAKDYATQIHEGQMYGEQPYMNHVEDVASGFDDPHLQRIAYLHDTIEDSETGIGEIHERFGEDVGHAVDALTRRQGEQYFDYINRVKEHPEATQVKLADLHSNLKNNPNESLARRYQKAIGILTNKSEPMNIAMRLLKYEGEEEWLAAQAAEQQRIEEATAQNRAGMRDETRSVPCTFCGAGIGEPCIGSPYRSHRARMLALGRKRMDSNIETGEPMDIAWRLLKGQYFHPSIRGYIDARSPGGVVQRRHRTRPVHGAKPSTFWDKHSFQTIPQMELPTMGRQTTLGEHHPDFPSPYGPVVYVHGTKPSNIPSIQRHGLIAGHGDYSGNFVSTDPDVKEIYGNNPMRQWEGLHRNLSGKGALVGIRAGAGTPEPYFGHSNDEQERFFPNHWLYNKDIDPKFLVNMGEESTPRALPEFYVDGKPPEFPEGMRNFDWEEWKSKWGAQE